MVKIAALLALALGFVGVTTATHATPKRSDSHHHEVAERGLERRETRYTPDHPDWYYLNGLTWWKVDATQQDHARLHAYLSMSAYGDFKKLCPSTFTRGFTVLQEFNVPGQRWGLSGYIAKIPEMEKIVIVFKGNSIEGMDWTPTSVDSFVQGCSGCKVAKSVVDLYLLAKKATNDFAVAKQAVKDTKLLFSVTGHGVGGAVAALAGLDFGSRNLVHYSHNQGMPRSFNNAAIRKYDNLFQVLAGQSLITRNDYYANIIPFDDNYAHVGSKIHITGDKTQWLTNCYGNNENSTCLGDSSSKSDHTYYFTAAGACGSANKGF